MKITTKLTSILVIAMSVGALGACTSYQIKYKNPAAQPGQTHEVTQSFYLWGLVGGSDVDFVQLCPSGVAEIASKSSFVDGLLFGFTGGLYSPRSVEVTCQSGVAFRVDRSVEGALVTALDPSAE